MVVGATVVGATVVGATVVGVTVVGAFVDAIVGGAAEVGGMVVGAAVVVAGSVTVIGSVVGDATVGATAAVDTGAAVGRGPGAAGAAATVVAVTTGTGVSEATSVVGVERTDVVGDLASTTVAVGSAGSLVSVGSLVDGGVASMPTSRSALLRTSWTTNAIAEPSAETMKIAISDRWRVRRGSSNIGPEPIPRAATRPPSARVITRSTSGVLRPRTASGRHTAHRATHRRRLSGFDTRNGP